MRKFLSLQKASLPNDSGKFIDNTKTRRNSRAYRGVISGKLHRLFNLIQVMTMNIRHPVAVMLAVCIAASLSFFSDSVLHSQSLQGM
jgi:hypothetical protein